MSSSTPINRITDRIVERLATESGYLNTTELLLVGIYTELMDAREYREKKDKDQATSVDMGPVTAPRRPGRPRRQDQTPPVEDGPRVNPAPSGEARPRKSTGE